MSGTDSDTDPGPDSDSQGKKEFNKVLLANEFKKVLFGQGIKYTPWNELIIQNLTRGELTNFLQVNKDTYTNATELYKWLLKGNEHLYIWCKGEKRLLGHALFMKAPDALINIMLDQKPDQVGEVTKVQYTTVGPRPFIRRCYILPLEIAIRNTYSLDIIGKIFRLTKKKIPDKWFMETNTKCLGAVINHFIDKSSDGIEKRRQTALFLLKELPILISNATPEYVNAILQDALSNKMESEVICRILELNNTQLDHTDFNGDTLLLLILSNPEVDNYINVLNMMAIISTENEINCIGKKNKKGDDALDIARNTNCSERVINSLCGFYNFSLLLQEPRTVELLEYVSYGSRATNLAVNFATYTIIGKMNEPAVLLILCKNSNRVSYDNFSFDTRISDHHLKPLKHSVLSMAINAKYGFDVITEIHKRFPSAVQLPYKKKFLNIINTPVVRTFPFHDLLYARLEYTIIRREIGKYDFPNVESYRRLYADIIVQPSLDKTEWHTLFYRLLGEGSLDYTEMRKLHRNIATTPMFWDENQLYPLEFVVRLGLGLTYVKTLYKAFPAAIAHNNYAVIFHSLRCRNNDLLYEDVILYLLKKLKGTILDYESPWNYETALSIAEQEHRTLELINAIKKKIPHWYNPIAEYYD